MQVYNRKAIQGAFVRYSTRVRLPAGLSALLWVEAGGHAVVSIVLERPGSRNSKAHLAWDWRRFKSPIPAPKPRDIYVEL